jgi:uncharacterized protein
MTEIFTPWPGPSATDSPFHAGELAIQERADVLAAAWSSGQRSIRPFMPDQHQAFFAEQPFMVLGGIDAQGQPWATLRVGAPGFTSALDAKTLRIAGAALPGDPLGDAWKIGSMIGGLGLQPKTRRRNRVNGVIKSLDDNALTLTVSQSFGNCAKYIQSRTPTFVARSESEPVQPASHAAALDDADRMLLERADTFFIASANIAEDAGRARGVDVSHRGGTPGFVRIDDAHTLTTPDFSGNRFFNTLGNLTHDPRAGLLFVDFERGDLIYMAADAEIIWDAEQIKAFPGAERLVRFHIREVRRSPGVLPFRWSPVEFAPQFTALLAARKSEVSKSWRPFKVVEIRQETSAIRSFYLEAVDGKPIAAFEPGQYLPIQIPVAGREEPLVRTYTLSDAHDGLRYRISVKREGIASTWLHDHVEVGTQINAKTPRGSFFFDASSPRPAVLLSAGIGITPMMAILNRAKAEGTAAAPPRAMHFIHGARNHHERPFADDLKRSASTGTNVSVHLLDSKPEPDDDASHGRLRGRVDIAQVKRLLPFDDYDFYLCGPTAFMSDMYDGLRALNVPDERIRFEAFGPASVKRNPTNATSVTAEGSVSSAAASQDTRTAEVVFARSERTIRWAPKDGTLLELAEANGIPTESNCRVGECGTCSTRLREGRVAYSGQVDAEIKPGCALLCVGRPDVSDVAGGARIVLDL